MRDDDIIVRIGDGGNDDVEPSAEAERLKKQLEERDTRMARRESVEALTVRDDDIVRIGDGGNDNVEPSAEAERLKKQLEERDARMARRESVEDFNLDARARRDREKISDGFSLDGDSYTVVEKEMAVEKEEETTSFSAEAERQKKQLEERDAKMARRESVEESELRQDD